MFASDPVIPVPLTFTGRREATHCRSFAGGGVGEMPAHGPEPRVAVVRHAFAPDANDSPASLAVVCMDRLTGL